MCARLRCRPVLCSRIADFMQACFATFSHTHRSIAALSRRSRRTQAPPQVPRSTMPRPICCANLFLHPGAELPASLSRNTASAARLLSGLHFSLAVPCHCSHRSVGSPRAFACSASCGRASRLALGMLALALPLLVRICSLTSRALLPQRAVLHVRPCSREYHWISDT